MNSTSSGNSMVRSVLSLFLLMILLLLTAGETEANEAPTASIDSVFPDPIYQNQSVGWNIIGPDTVGYWPFDNGTGTTAYDHSGNENHGTLYNEPTWVDGINGKALEFDGSNDYVKMTGVDVDTAAGAKNTVDFWMYWDGVSGTMPFSWDVSYTLYFGASCLGFNTGQSDVLGFSPSGLENRWVHVSAVFYNGVPSSTHNELYINGEKQSLSACTSNSGTSRTVTSTSFIAAFSQNSNYKFSGIIDEVRIHNSAVNVTELYPTSNRTLFYGTGTDSDGTVANYTWSSSKDGVLSHNRNDTIYATDLSLGNHTISFKVQDNNGTWSDEDTIYLTVKSFPTANVVSISPNPAHQGAQVNFTGTGTDPDGTIVGYQWRSSLDGNLSSNASFSNSSLSYGNHSIYFKVRDNESLWSGEVLAYLYVNAKPVADIDFILPFEAYQNPGTFDSNLSVWRYVKPVTISPVPLVDDYQVRVKLNSSNFDYDKADSTGADVRFYDPSQSKLEYWIETWDTDGNSTIWVNVEKAGTKTMYLYYGNSLVEDESNLSIFSSYSETIIRQGNNPGTKYLNFPIIDDVRVLPYQSLLSSWMYGDFDWTNEHITVHHNGIFHTTSNIGNRNCYWQTTPGYPTGYTRIDDYRTISTYETGTLELKVQIIGANSAPCTYNWNVKFTLAGHGRKYASPEPVAKVGLETDALTGIVFFNGSAFDPDDNITSMVWNSSIDGTLSSDYNFSLLASALSIGNHEITFQVQSSNGIWSELVTSSLVVRAFPEATIDSITPSSAAEGTTISFDGSGNDPDGTITAYEWQSSIDGLLSTNSTFTNSSLSYGNHTITLRVMDNESFWSLNATKFLVINSVPSVEINSIDPDPAYQGEGGLFSESTLNWDYSRVITLSEPTILDNYSIRLDFDPTWFDFVHVLSDGEDIRFYDNSGNELDYWIQLWNASTTSIVWVSVPDSGTDRLVMQYGESSALAMSNGSKVFSNYYDFESGFDGWEYYETDYHFGYERKELKTDSQEHALELRIKNNNAVDAWEYCEYRKFLSLPEGQNLVIGFSEADNRGNQSNNSLFSKRFRIDSEYLFSDLVVSNDPPYDWIPHELNVSDYAGQDVTLKWRLILTQDLYNGNAEVYLDWLYLRYDDGQNLTATIGPEISTNSIKLIGSATDLDGIIIQYSWNSSLDGVVGTERNLSIDPDLLSIGTHNITFTARDDFGSWASEVSIQLTIKSFPNATITSVSPNPVPFGEDTLFSGSGVDPDGTIVSYLWWSDLDGILSTSASFTTADLSNGNHTIFFNVRDNEGLWGKEAFLELRVNLIPTAAIQSSDGWLTEGDIFSAVGDASDADGEVIEHQWISSIDGIIADTQSVAYDELSNGTHLITYRVKDNDGHWSLNASAIVTVNGIPRITGADYPQLINEGDTAFFNLSYYDDDYVDAFEWISDRDGLIGDSASFQREAGTALTNGTHDITVRVRDNSGVWSDYTHIAMRVNGIPRIEPLVELDHFLIEGDNVNLEINVVDFEGLASIEWEVDGNVSTGTDYLLLDSLANGSHTVRVRAIDSDGVWSSYTVFTLIVNGIPRGTIVEPPGVWLTGDELVIQGIGSDDGEDLVFRWVYQDDIFYGENITIVHSASESVTISLTLIDEFNTSSSEMNRTVLFHHRPTATIVSADTVSNHTVLQVVGGGNDDGTITMYHWVSDIEGVLGDGPSLSFHSMSIGYHDITLTVKDDHEIWSYPVSTQIYIDDGDNQFPPADVFPLDPTQWFDRDGDGWGDNPKGNHSDAFPDDPDEWLDTDGDGVGDNSDLFVSTPNIFIYGTGGLVAAVLGMIGLELRTRSGIPRVLEGLENLVSEGMERDAITVAIENLKGMEDFQGIGLLSSDLSDARSVLSESLATQQKMVDTMTDLANFREELSAMQQDGMEVGDMLASINKLELQLAQQASSDSSVKYLETLQSKFVESQEFEE